jgi:hypothetical protein
VNEKVSSGIFFKAAFTAREREPRIQHVTYCQTVKGPVPRRADPIVSFTEPWLIISCCINISIAKINQKM